MKNVKKQDLCLPKSEPRKYDPNYKGEKTYVLLSLCLELNEEPNFGSGTEAMIQLTELVRHKIEKAKTEEQKLLLPQDIARLFNSVVWPKSKGVEGFKQFVNDFWFAPCKIIESEKGVRFVEHKKHGFEGMTSTEYIPDPFVNTKKGD